MPIPQETPQEYFDEIAEMLSMSDAAILLSQIADFERSGNFVDGLRLILERVQCLAEADRLIAKFDESEMTLVA